MLGLLLEFVDREGETIVLGTAVAAAAVLGFRYWRRRRRRRPLVTGDLLGILTLSPYGFETFCRDLLEREGFRAVATRRSGDEGIDVELVAPDGRRGVVQCKHAPTARIGRPVIQQLYGEMISRHALFGYVMTTGTFTEEAKTWARTKTITLVDRDGLLAMAL